MKFLFQVFKRVLAPLSVMISMFVLGSSAQAKDWNVEMIDRLLTGRAPGQGYVQIGDMQVSVAYLNAWRNQLAGNAPGGPAAAATASSGFTAWTGGNVYYTFDASVSTANRKVFLDSAALWATFANLHFTLRTSEPNFIVVSNNPSLGGGLSYVGMIGGPQLFQIGSSSWNHGTVCHELGHALGLVHEQQRSDRDSYVTIQTGNILPGQEGNFVKLTSSQNYTGYDFMSVMHYSRNAFSVDDELNTIQPLPAYIQYLDVMGEQLDYVLSLGDRQGMAAIYGAGPGATNIVTNTQDSGPGSLRTALYYAFDHPGTTVSFNIPASDPGFSNNVFNIRPTDSLPSLVNATVLDGGTQPTNSNPAGPEILIDGALCRLPSVYCSGLRLAGTNNTVRSIVVNNFPKFGLLISGTNAVGNTVAGCFLGVDPTGTFRVTNGICPIQIELGAASNSVGGVTVGDRNIISGSRLQGMVIRDVGTSLNTVQGNYIGLNASGTAALPNAWAGLEILDGAVSNLVGGYTSAARNVISGNTFQGVLISDSNSIGNIVAGNFIGLNAAGTTAIPNGWSGVEISSGAHQNTIGGLVAGARNVISGNTQNGAMIADESDGNRVAGNYLGLNPAGTAAIGNGWSGVQLYFGPSGNVIDGNVISGNSQAGILMRGATTTGNAVRGNLIGLNAAGTSAVSNTWSGIDIRDFSSGNTIGGMGSGRNFISGNGNYGVFLYNGSSNQVVGNTMGLNISNTLYVPNVYAGVAMWSGASANQIGGVAYGAANLIIGNGGEGIQLSDANTLYNTVRGNSIVSNASVGIGSYNGANAPAAAPVLTSAVLGTSTVVRGTLTGLASTTFQIDFYANPVAAGSPEGMTYLGAYPATTSAGGTVTFTNNLGAHIPAGRIITATATDPSGNTSSFSGGATVTTTSTPNDGIPDAWRAVMFGGAGTTTNSTSCATCDPDGDGMNNRGEFLSGTNPTNSASVLKLTALNPAGSGNVASLPSVSGITYRVESRDDIVTSPWSLVVDQLVGTGGPISISDTNAVSLLKRFYRAGVLW